MKFIKHFLLLFCFKICYYPDGAVYDGDWKNDYREGKGVN